MGSSQCSSEQAGEGPVPRVAPEVSRARASLAETWGSWAFLGLEKRRLREGGINHCLGLSEAGSGGDGEM